MRTVAASPSAGARSGPRNRRGAAVTQRRAAWRRAGIGLLAGLLAVLATNGCRSTAGRAVAEVRHPQSADEVRQIVDQARRPVLVVFTSESCVTCRTMRPALAGVAADYAGRLVVVEADLALTGALIGEYNLLKVPTVIVFRDGREVARRHGLLPAPFMASFIDEAIRASR